MNRLTREEMAEDFFGFKTDFPSKEFGRRKFDDDMVPDEEEYDALNDETFGIGADDGDWEEDHDKFAGIKGKSLLSTDSSLFESYDGEDSQHEIVSQSISQLGLEDDLDDPAIMTIHRSQRMWPISSRQRSSPPPPAIILPELSGSPKTHSIWSTNSVSTPAKESGIGSLFSSIGNSSSSFPRNMSPMSPIPCNVFSSPLTTKAWTLEEIERDLKSPKPVSCWSASSSIPSEQNSLKLTRGIPDISTPESSGGNRERKMPSRTVPGIRTLDDVETDILLNQAPTVEQVERSMQVKAAPEPDINHIPWQANMRNTPPKPVVWPFNNVIRPGFVSPRNPSQGARMGGPFSPYPTPVIENANNFAGSFRPNFKPVHVYPPPPMNPLNNAAFAKNQAYRKNEFFFPTSVLNSQNMKNVMFPGRFVRHPLLGADYIWHYPPPNRHSFGEDFRRMPYPENYDEYSGLMTQWEKEWLLKIQLMLVQTNNPYVEDFYYSTFLARKCVQEALRKKPDKKDTPKLLLPERAKTETKAYVPAQFEGSLGKLQAVSVNFPRKVLDITVSRHLDDEEGDPVANQNVTKNRRLLLNIEKLYNHLLEIDYEEKTILALPDDAHPSHLANIEKLTEKIHSGLGCETVTAPCDTFHNVIMIRKGRSLAVRSFELFSKVQKRSFLVCLCRCLSHVLRKDQNDLILLKNIEMILNCVKTLGLEDIVALGQSLENLPRTDTVIVPVREKSNFLSAFKNKFGCTLVCCIIERAENVYSGSEDADSGDQAKWAKVILHVVDIICTIPDASIVPPVVPHDDLLAHFQRFAIDRDKFEVLKKKLDLFKSSSSDSAV